MQAQKRGWIALAVLAIVAVAVACVLWFLARERPPESELEDLPRLALVPSSFSALEGWDSDRHAGALSAFQRSCRRLLTLPDDRSMGGAGFAGTVADWRGPCETALAMGTDVTDDAARAFFANNFRVFAIADRGKRDGLFTGYYEPELRGSRTPSDRFSVPIYRRPDDLVTVDLGAFNDEWRGRRLAGRVEDGRLKPYPTRADITSGALSDQGLELVWVDDPIGAFFLQVQGSGRVRLEEGGDLRIGYAATNGRPYRSIGREMIARGLMKREEVSLQSLRDWLKSHPDQATEILNANPSFVFFRELPEDGPIGAQGVALTPGRSLAVDRAFMPLGVPVWLETTYPDGVEEAGTPLQRLLIAQDTGGAIKGIVRGDVFWGSGERAERIAGHMKQTGRYAVLLPIGLGKSTSAPLD